MGILFNPINLYIFGGVLLWASDVLDLLGSTNFSDLAWKALALRFGFPTSNDDFVIHLIFGATVATFSWFVGSMIYASRRGWS